MHTPESTEEILQLEPDGEDAWRVRLEPFGGEALGCAARAAVRSCPGRHLHAFHGSFLRPVPPEEELSLRVERVRDGRRFSTRRVHLLHGERLLFEARASFAAGTDGLAYQHVAAPDAPGPDDPSLEHEDTIARAEAWEDWRPGPITWRRIGPSPREVAEQGIPMPEGAEAWIGPRERLPDDPSLHVGALFLATDILSHFGVVRRLGRDLWHLHVTSLDHAVWVHRPVVWDDWWLFCTTSEIAAGGRALSRREVFDRGGRLVATVVQEALITPPA